MRATTKAHLHCWGFLVVTQLLLFAGIISLARLVDGWPGFVSACLFAIAWGLTVSKAQTILKRKLKKQVKFEARSL